MLFLDDGIGGTSLDLQSPFGFCRHAANAKTCSRNPNFLRFTAGSISPILPQFAPH